jgi:hypothetical protein
MVWGMALPGSFGPFFPNGDYVGWHDDLKNYFKNEMPNEEKALFVENGWFYASYAMSKFAHDPGKQMPDYPPFTPIEPHEAPNRFVLQKKYLSLGSLINTESRILAVDEPLKDIIERFEPGVHSFFPLEISMPYRENYQTYFENYPKQFFILAIGQYIDSFSPEQSDPGVWKEMRPGHFQYVDDEKSMSGLALSKHAFGSAHLWRERRMAIPLICFSDQMMAEITAAGLRLPKRYRLKELRPH